MLHHLAAVVDRVVSRSGRETILSRLRQAGWGRDADEGVVLSTYRITQLKSLGSGMALGFALATVLGLSLSMKLLMVVLGLVVGVTRQRGLVDKAIDRRRQLMRIEIYTVNQLLAMRVRAGGSVVRAVQATVDRGKGEVVSELASALRLHRAGWRAADAFRRLAEQTPEPFCSRTYRLLASAEERGTDLARALLALSEDVRETRREGIRRSATRRRAAMLIPTIAVLAPVLILFVAAPLPFLITGWQ